MSDYHIFINDNNQLGHTETTKHITISQGNTTNTRRPCKKVNKSLCVSFTKRKESVNLIVDERRRQRVKELFTVSQYTIDLLCHREPRRVIVSPRQETTQHEPAKRRFRSQQTKQVISTKIHSKSELQRMNELESMLPQLHKDLKLSVIKMLKVESCNGKRHRLTQLLDRL